MQNSRPAKKLTLLAVLIMAVCSVVLAAHWPALSAKAISLDDDQYLIKNPLVQNPGWSSARSFLTEILKPSTVKGYYQPLSMISLMIDYRLGGRQDNLLPFHRTSLVLHLANTALIIVLLYLLFGLPWAAAAAGLLFGVHPLTVEPVAWVSDRKTLLAAFFSLWSLILYVYPRVTSHKSRVTRFYIGSFVAYLLALMSKPTSIPLPALMVLMDYWPLKKLNWQSLLKNAPLFVPGGAFAVITYVSQKNTSDITSPAALGASHIFLKICHNIVFYLCKIVWPVRLSSFYPVPEPFGLSQPAVLGGLIGTIIIIALLVASSHWTPAALTGWLFFFIAVLPTTGIIGFTKVVAADKHVYLPSTGLLMVLVSFLAWVVGKKQLVLKYAMVAGILTASVAEVSATHHYLAYWRDTATLNERMIALTPDPATVHYAIAAELSEQGRNDEAIYHYLKAIGLKSDFADAHYSLGCALYSKGKPEEAVRQYNIALKLKPNSAEILNNLGIALMSLGKIEDAVGCYTKAIRIISGYAETHNNLGNTLKAQGKLDEAVAHFRKAMQLNRENANFYYNLGLAIQAQGKFEESAVCFREAMRLRPGWPLPQQALDRLKADSSSLKTH